MPLLADEDLPQGGRRHLIKSANWIQRVLTRMKEGSFTKQAKQHHMKSEKFASEVLAHPRKYQLKTRRRAQFFKNIRRKTSRKN